MSGDKTCGASERSGPGRYLPSWSRRSSATASSPHGCLGLDVGFLRHGSPPDSVAGRRGLGVRRCGKSEESFAAGAAAAERRRVAENAMGLGFSCLRWGRHVLLWVLAVRSNVWWLRINNSTCLEFPANWMQDCKSSVSFRPLFLCIPNLRRRISSLLIGEKTLLFLSKVLDLMF